ncbi:MAG: hypothetical protein ACKVW3_10045 [Phycisphaerales bacterium]
MIDRSIEHGWLLELTQIPTAAGREHRVARWVERWAADRPEILLRRDAAGNLELRLASSDSLAPPIYFTAHMDHPAFVVDEVLPNGSLALEFRGGVMADYFINARVSLHPKAGPPIAARLLGQHAGPRALYLAQPDAPSDSPPPAMHPAAAIRKGDIATWELPPARIEDGLIHTHACDDLAALAAALAAFDRLRLERTRNSESAGGGGEQAARHDVRVLLTRAEEIGFIGAIAACRDGTIPPGSRILALENSRSFPDSPIGGGPIVRVGDRLSVFSPALTAAVAQRAEEAFGGPASPTASQKLPTAARPWQRKLMSGGACEATVFCDFGFQATCLCLALGNYHNMADLANVQAGTNTAPARVGHEFVSIADFDGLVDLLVACGERLPPAPSARPLIDKLWNQKHGVLGE